MPKILPSPITRIQKPLPSSPTTTDDTSTTPTPSPFNPSPPQKQPSTPATPFLASRSEIRSAFASPYSYNGSHNKHDNRQEQKQKQVVPSYLPGNLDVAFTGTSVDKRSDGIHFESDPNRCFRLADGGLGGGGGDGNDGGGGVRAVPARERERYGVNELLQEGEGGGGGGRASGKGGTAAVVAHDDETYDGKNATDDMDQDFEDVDDLPPGLDTDLPTALRQFAWAYVRGLGGLVMGVLDGFTKGAPERYVTYGGDFRERGRS